MNVTSKITVDLTRQNVGQRVNAVQGDGNTRYVEITLLAGGVPWTPPDGAEAAIAYMQPSGTKGMYNLLADGTAAISISGNVATVILAHQMLTTSGTVQASLVLNDAQLNRLTTFPFAVSVTSNPAAGAQKTEDYIRLQWLDDKLDEYLRKAADSGAFDGAPGQQGPQGEAGPQGPKGDQGPQGERGNDGHTPEKGTDYFTADDIDQFKLEVSTTSVSETLLASGWTGSMPYAQTITVAALTDGWRCRAYPAYDGDDTDANHAMREACACLSYAKRDGQNITFTCLEDKPKVDINVIVEVYV